jgi:hypothetical protein
VTYTRHSEPALAGEGICLGDCQVVLPHWGAKARYPNIIVAILTAYDLPEYREFSRQYADYFFSKDSSTTENIFTLVQSILPIPA